MLSILLINPPSPFLINQKAIPPLGLLYLGAYLHREGYPVSLLDLAGQELPDTARDWPKADLYGITATTPQYLQALQIKCLLKKRKSACHVVLGGPHASALPSTCLSDRFDSVVCGEGEESMCLAAAGLLLSTLTKPVLGDLDDLPLPAWDLIDLSSYGYNFGYGPSFPLLTSRGCSWGRCAFCSSIFRGVRFHSPDRVLQEMEYLHTQGFRAFQFLDDAFTAHPQRLQEILENIALIGAKWRCYSRAGINKELLEKMREAGCVEIGFGAESGDQGILDRVYKGTKVAENTQFVKDCQKVGITVQAFLMVGLPGETQETIQKTQDWFLEARPDKFGLNIFLPYPNSLVYNNPKKYGIQMRKSSWEDMYVKGPSPLEIRSMVSTETLSFKAVEEAYLKLMNAFTRVTGFVPGEING